MDSVSSAKPTMLSKCTSEFIGTFFLVFTIGLNVIQGTFLAPVSIGFILMVMIFATGGVSGGHFNPAVTLAVFLSGTSAIDLPEVGAFVAAQLCGGSFASALYWLLLGSTFTLHPGDASTMVDAAIVEILFSGALIFVILNTACLHKEQVPAFYMEFNALSIGFTLMSAAFAIGPISGCSLNPAVSFAVVTSHAMNVGLRSRFGLFDRYCLYLICPVVGALLAVGGFRFVIHKREVGEIRKKLRKEMEYRSVKSN
eukprot:CAMPEP_0194482638 /NCGR_PEP_ID=MMETSP0253-20130528/4495_1 /TAXON_ID=2966 /ORGANISM="Noctiluca scintillans" /LENGTH=254 /DNA_ID=CAMNT_0039322189 /DNA_START=76 /DNA_END=840 /DNA_ORIENTATION=+